MRFCTRAQLSGVLATLAFLTALVYPAHPALAQQGAIQISEQSEAATQSQGDESQERNRSDNLDEFLRLINRPSEFDFFETPLKEVAEQISDQHSVNVIFDFQALEGFVDTSEPVSFELRDVSLGTGLDLMLRQYDLDYYLHDNVLVITSLERLENELHAHVYNVRDLLNAERPWQSIDMLMEVIVGSIESDSWDELGGPASIHSYQGNLIISQTWRQHLEIVRLLNTLRTNIQAMGGPTLPLRPPVSPQQAAGGGSGGGGGGFGGAGGGGGGFFRVGDNARGKEEANAETDPFDAGDKSEAGLDPFGDSDPFAEPSGVDKTKEESRKVSEGQCERSDETEIGRRVAAELVIRYYNTRLLLRSRDPDVALDEIIELLTATVETGSWEKLGGAGTIGQYEGILVIGNTPFIHTKVAAFLNDLGNALTEAGGVELTKPGTSGRQEGFGGRRSRR